MEKCAGRSSPRIKVRALVVRIDDWRYRHHQFRHVEIRGQHHSRWDGIEKGETRKIQNIVNELTEKTTGTNSSLMRRNAKNFGSLLQKKQHPEYAPIVINDKPIEIVTTIKLPRVWTFPIILNEPSYRGNC